MLELKNSGHHTLFNDRGPCARTIVVHFLRKRRAGNTDCARRPGHIWQAVGRFSRRAGPSRRRAGRIVVETLIDAFQRAFLQSGQDGVGLRGGTFHTEFSDSGLSLHLAAARFAKDLAVTGDAKYAGFRTIDADLTVRGAHDGTLHVHGAWASPHAKTLSISGQLDGRPLSMSVPAN